MASTSAATHLPRPNPFWDSRKEVIADVVAQHVRAQTPVTSYREFWETVAKTLREQHEMDLYYSTIQRVYARYRKWAH